MQRAKVSARCIRRFYKRGLQRVIYFLAVVRLLRTNGHTQKETLLDGKNHVMSKN